MFENIRLFLYRIYFYLMSHVFAIMVSATLLMVQVGGQSQVYVNTVVHNLLYNHG